MAVTRLVSTRTPGDSDGRAPVLCWVEPHADRSTRRHYRLGCGERSEWSAVESGGSLMSYSPDVTAALSGAKARHGWTGGSHGCCGRGDSARRGGSRQLHQPTAGRHPVDRARTTARNHRPQDRPTAVLAKPRRATEAPPKATPRRLTATAPWRQGVREPIRSQIAEGVGFEPTKPGSPT